MLSAVPIEALIVYAVLALLVAVTVVALVLVVRASRDIAQDMRRVHLQQANIIRMLLKAGFRPAKGRDWFDDGGATQVRGDGYTAFDWRQPPP